MKNRNVSSKNWLVALLLCIFLGYLGGHRFYVGKIGTGILWLLTVGLFGIGYIVDLLLIASFKFKDSYGEILK
ncbi:TM2 domain-containing protein [Mycoplasmatota bacterium]|nr:TM2 domain-containing protein [Mycoplasmatota bacterium]